MLRGLLVNKRHWLLSEIAKYNRRGNDTNNRIEGICILLKNQAQHKILYFSQLFELTLDERIISEEDANKIGSIALKFQKNK